MLTGAILLTAAEQSYAHSCLIPFPHHESAVQIFVPASVVLLALGMIFLVWGVITEPARTKPDKSA